jgi:hypothetical protein
MRLKLALALSLLAVRSQSDVDVTLRDNRVFVRTVRAPLAEILSRFAQATGAEVVYESARPRQLVSVVIEAATTAEAIARLLEGQGLNYAVRLDPTGKNVEMLVITGSTSPPAAAAGAGRTSSPITPAWRPPEEDAEADAGELDQPFAPEEPAAPEPAAPPATPPADSTTNPAARSPWLGGAPGAPPGIESSSPGPMSGAPPIAGSPTPEPGQPQVPGAASYPGSPPVPPQPVFPAPASY